MKASWGSITTISISKYSCFKKTSRSNKYKSFAEIYCANFDLRTSKQEILAAKDLLWNAVEFSEKINFAWAPNVSPVLLSQGCSRSCIDIFSMFLREYNCKSSVLTFNISSGSQLILFPSQKALVCQQSLR